MSAEVLTNNIVEVLKNEKKINGNIITRGLSEQLLKESNQLDNIDDIQTQLKESKMSMIESIDNPRLISEKEIIETFVFKNMVFNNPDFFTKTCYSVILDLTANFADGIKQYLMPVEALTLNYAWCCFNQLIMSLGDTQKIFPSSIDNFYELPYFISKSNQNKIKSFISEFSAYSDKSNMDNSQNEIIFLSFCPFNSSDYCDFNQNETPVSANSDIFLVSFISWLYYDDMLNKQEELKSINNDENRKIKEQDIKDAQERMESFQNTLNDFISLLPKSADILNVYKD